MSRVTKQRGIPIVHAWAPHVTLQERLNRTTAIFENVVMDDDELLVGWGSYRFNPHNSYSDKTSMSGAGY
jgi:hypothetical protein